MNRNQTADALEQLLQTPEKRSKMGRFRDVADLVERAASAGVQRAAILATLKEQGLELSPATLNSYLTRYRKASGRSQTAPSSAPLSVGRTPAPDGGTDAPEAQELTPGATPKPRTGAELKSGPESAPAVAEPPPLPATRPLPAPTSPAPAVGTGRSIREIRQDTVDFEAARRWSLERIRQQKAEAKKPPGPSKA